MAVSKKEVLLRWDSFRKNLVRETPVPIETEVQKQKRIERLKGNFEEFCQYYFPNYCTAPFAKFHLKLARKAIENDCIYMVAALAREHAKSVLFGLFIPAYLKFTGKLRNMLIVSHNNENAAELLMPLMINLESNARIIADYGKQKGYRGWEVGRLITTDSCSFRAIGAGQSPRGSRNEEARPDCILIDDIDTDEESRNEARQKKKWSWIEEALFPTMSISGAKRFFVVGNIISKTGMVMRAGKLADFFMQINILDKNGEPSWKERYTLDQVNYMLSKISYVAGQKEYFNNPINEGSVFRDIKWGKVPPLSRFKFLISYGDASYKDSRKNDFKAVPLLGILDGVLYIINCRLEQTTTKNMIEWYYDLQDYVGGATQVYNAIECNGFQDAWFTDVFTPQLNQVEKQKGLLPIIPDDRSKPDKFSRIEGNLEPLNRNGKMVFNEAERNNPHMMRLEEQFKAIEPSLPGHDDGPDAVEGGYFMANNKLRTITPLKVGANKRSKYKY